MVHWITTDGQIHVARLVRCGVTRVRLEVSSLGGLGWAWLAWDEQNQDARLHGLTETLEQAMARAEGAAEALLTSSSIRR